MPSDANGVPFTAGYVDVGGNLIANMRANVPAEAIGRRLVTRLLELTDDPGMQDMQDMLKFLIGRDTMHQQQWLAVLEELVPEMATNAPGDYDNESGYQEHAYSFLNHLMDHKVPRTPVGPLVRRSTARASSRSRSPRPPTGRSRSCSRRRPRPTPASRRRQRGRQRTGRFVRSVGDRVTPG